MKVVRLLPAAAIVVAAAAAGCSGGYGDPNGPDSLRITAASVHPNFGANSEPGFLDYGLSPTSNGALSGEAMRIQW